MDAALAAGADAVHPGYGFLAENAEFAELVQRAGLTWIGPPPEAMRSLGDKVEARRLAEAAGLRVVPGYAGIDLSDATLTREAERLGAPVVVKAAAGGGGRGMRAVSDLVEMPDALAAARREAAAAFGDDRVFVEREMPDVRHVEVQLLADAHGTVLHLGERDCSVQRRHQKVIEESPSPAVDPALRAELGEAAVALGRAAGYVGAGTVEFLLDSEGGWYFLELNARLQVEHPVTEAVTGIDLVRAQIEIAGGTPLLTEQDEVVLRGHAIQCRLYAEDPAREFLPATGRLERFDVPAWPGGRTDTGVRQGDLVGVRYDPLLAKVIAHAEDRDACLDRISAMLGETVVLGVETNLGFLLHTIDDPVFRSGEADTGYVEQHWSSALIPELPAGVAASAPGDVWQEYGDGSAGAGSADGRQLRPLPRVRIPDRSRGCGPGRPGRPGRLAPGADARRRPAAGGRDRRRRRAEPAAGHPRGDEDGADGRRAGGRAGALVAGGPRRAGVGRPAADRAGRRSSGPAGPRHRGGGRPPRRAPERVGRGRHGSQDPLRRGPGGRRPPGGRGDLLRPPRPGAAAGRRRRRPARHPPPAWCPLPGAGSQRPRPGAGAGRGRGRRSRCSRPPARRSRRPTSA